MRPVVKGLLIGCLALLVIVMVAIFIGIRYLQKNKDRFQAEATQITAQAKEFGSTTTESGCVAEGLTRYRNDRSFMGQIRTRVWLSGCLEASKAESAFCNGVPLESEIVVSAKWRLAECGKLGFENDTNCGNLLAAVQDYCKSPERAAKRP